MRHLFTDTDIEHELHDASSEHKVCVSCKTNLHKSNFPKHIAHKDGLDSRCRTCVKKQSKVRQKLYKTAPPKPELCECCGKKPEKWTLDHDHKTDKFRGWICENCNHAIGKLGDCLDGLMLAVNYLKRAERK